MPLTSEKFEALLNWLNSDRDVAARRYIIIQNGLIGMFSAKGFSNAEDLGDQAINRVADRLPEIGPDYDGEPEKYFRGVARKIIFEAGRRKEIATDRLPDCSIKQLDVSDEYKCLGECLNHFPLEKRNLILDYHVYDGSEKIVNHTRMAKELKLSVNALRVKAFRVRTALQKCVLECIERLKGNENEAKKH